MFTQRSAMTPPLKIDSLLACRSYVPAAPGEIPRTQQSVANRPADAPPRSPASPAPSVPDSPGPACCPRYAPDHGVPELVSAGQGRVRVADPKGAV